MTSADIVKYWLIYAEVISPGIVIFRRSFTPHEIIFWRTRWNICRLRISRLHFSAAAVTNKICRCQGHFLKYIFRLIKNYCQNGRYMPCKDFEFCKIFLDSLDWTILYRYPIVPARCPESLADGDTWNLKIIASTLGMPRLSAWEFF